MNFKTIGLNVATATVAAAGLAMTVAPAEAATLGPGGFAINGTSTLTSSLSGFTVSFNNPMNLVGGNGVFAGGNLAGTPVVDSLELDLISSSGGLDTYSFGAVANFITGLTQEGESVVFDLNAGTLFGNIDTLNDYTLANFGNPLTGVLKDANGSVFGTATIGVFEFSGFLNSANISIVTEAEVIPTPALLPGLLGLGMGAIRRRNSAAKADKIKA